MTMGTHVLVPRRDPGGAMLETPPYVRPAFAPHQGDAVGDLREFFRTIWRWKWTILGLTFGLTMLCTLVLFQITPLYKSDAMVMLEARESKVVDLEAVVAGLPPDVEILQSEIEVMRSRDLMAKVVDHLGLAQLPEFNRALRPPNRLGALLGLDRWLFPLIAGEATELSADERRMAERNRVVSELLKRVSVSAKGRSRVVAIVATSEDPRLAATIANTVADLYIVEQLEGKFEATRRATAWLNERIGDLRESVAVSEEAVEDFRRKSGLIKGRSVNLTSEQASELNTQLILASTSRAEAEARLAQARKLMASPGRGASTTEVLNSPLIQSLKQQQAEVERRAAELSVEHGEKHPKMINIRAEQSDIGRKIRAEIGKIVQGLENEVRVARVRESSLKESLNSIKSTVASSNQAEVQLRALEREANADRMLLETFLARYKETSAQQDIKFQQPDARLISRGAVPEFPSSPKKKLIVPLVAVGSAIIGVLLAFLIEHLNPGFRSAQELEAYTGHPVLGLLPKHRGRVLRGRRLHDRVANEPSSEIGEAIRTIHTSIHLTNMERRPRSILVTSSEPGEGKTTLSIGLARTAARSFDRVVLVDADLRRPAVHRLAGVRAGPGLTELLTGEADLREVIQTDPLSGAHIIAAGATDPNPPALFTSSQMRRQLMKLAEQYDLVILDSPPVLAVSDTRILAQLVDGTLFAVRWYDTKREAAGMGLRQIVTSGGAVMGTVLSMVVPKKYARYGGYGGYGIPGARTRRRA